MPERALQDSVLEPARDWGIASMGAFEAVFLIIVGTLMMLVPVLVFRR